MRIKKLAQSSIYLVIIFGLFINLLACGKSDKPESEKKQVAQEQAKKKPIILKIGHALDTTHPVHSAMEFMAKELDTVSKGTMKIEIFPNGQLGNERELVEQLQLGALDMTKVATSVLESFLPDAPISVLSLPYLFRDDEHRWKVLLGEIGKKLLLCGEKQSLRGLCYFDAGSRSFYIKNKPINTPADLKGLKIRVQKSQLMIKTIEALGASATPISWGELYTALSQGVVDGAENNIPSFYTSRHYEVCKYYSLDEHSSVPDIMLISTSTWQRLTPEQQTMLTMVANKAVTYQKALWAKQSTEFLAQLKENGVKVNIPDKAPFIKAVQPIYDELQGTEIGNLVKAIRQVK